MVNSIDSQQVEKLDTAEVFKQLESSYEGLSAIEVQKRLTQFDRNTLKEKKVNIPRQSRGLPHAKLAHCASSWAISWGQFHG